jgi:hypothetical protein
MIYNYAFQGIETCISRSESPTFTLSMDIRSEQVNGSTCRSGIAKHNALLESVDKLMQKLNICS